MLCIVIKIKNIIKHLENARINQTLMTSNEKNVDVIGIDIGKYDVVITCFVDANHAGNVVNRRSQTGILIFLNKAPLYWYSK